MCRQLPHLFSSLIKCSKHFSLSPLSTKILCLGIRKCRRLIFNAPLCSVGGYGYHAISPESSAIEYTSVYWNHQRSFGLPNLMVPTRLCLSRWCPHASPLDAFGGRLQGLEPSTQPPFLGACIQVFNPLWWMMMMMIRRTTGASYCIRPEIFLPVCGFQTTKFLHYYIYPFR